MTDPKKIGIILLFAFVGWALCGAAMGAGLATTTEANALILHAIAAPIIFAGLSYLYFKKYNFTTPLQTAGIFVSFIIIVDFFIVAMVINKSFDKF